MNQNHENTKYFTTYTFFWIQVFIKGIDEFHPIMEKNVFHNLFVWFSLINSPFFNKILVFHELVSFLKRNFNNFVRSHVWKRSKNCRPTQQLPRFKTTTKILDFSWIDRNKVSIFSARRRCAKVTKPFSEPLGFIFSKFYSHYTKVFEGNEYLTKIEWLFLV